MRLKKRMLCLLMVCMMIAMVQAPVSFAAEGDAVKNVITGFVPLEQTEFYFEGEPEEADLVAAFPDRLHVYLDGSSKPSYIPVKWETVEDYDDTEYYFYSVKPVWSEPFTLSSELDPVMDVPWITVFRQASEEEIGEGEKKLEIPVEEPENLKPVYTEEDGSVDPDSLGEISLARLMALCTESSYAASASDVAKIYKYLTGTMGLNMAAASAVMTNLYAESGMLSNNLENKYNALYGLSDSQYTSRVNKGKKNNGKYTSGYGKTRYFTKDYSGYGICQWTSLGRRAKLLKSAVDKDVSIANLNMQLAFLQKELESSYAQVWGTLKNVPNNACGVYLAAAHFCVSFEVPANTKNTAASRARNALSTYWKTYSGKSASASGTSYLGLCGYTYPKTLKKGAGMTVSGQVISNYKVTSITAKILNSKGSAIYSKTIRPSTTVYSLYNFDNSMKFSKLSAGTYTYQITAKDSKGKSVTAKHQFKVSSGSSRVVRGCAAGNVSTSAKTDGTTEAESSSAKTKTSETTEATTEASTLRGVGLTYPKTLKKGRGFTIKGKIRSNRELKKVVITVKTTKGKKKLGASAKPSGKKTYNLYNLDSRVIFGKLPKGKYYYIVKATDKQKSKTILKKKFTVK